MQLRVEQFLHKANKFLEKKSIVFSIIAALTLLVYINSISAPFTLDDYGSIVNNLSIRDPFNFVELWKFYSNRVVLYFTFAVNYAIHDTGLEGYHATNMALHAFNGFLVYLLLNEILGLKYFKYRLAGRYAYLISTAAALIFVCHPLQINAVTYIVQRTAALAATFYFLAVYFFLKYRKNDKLYNFLLTLLFTVIAMFTKENTITIPFLLLIIELMFFLRDGKTPWWKRVLMFSVLFLTVPIIPGTNLFLKGYSQSDPSVNFKASTSMDRFQYFYTEMNVIVLYIRLLFIPDWQNFDYSNDFPMSNTIWQNNSYISLIFVLVTGIYGLLNFKKNKLVSLGIIWFYVGLAVESSFISIKDVYFEHRLYFPIAGFVMFIMGLIFGETRKLKERRYRLKQDENTAMVLYKGNEKRNALYGKALRTKGIWKYRVSNPLLLFTVITVFSIIFYSGLTIKRNYVYSDSIRLWSDTVKKAPDSDRAHSVLASGYMDAYEANKKKYKDYLDISIIEFKKAISLYPRNSTAHCNLSKAYLLKKDYEKCIDEAKKTLQISRSEYACNNMGLAYKEMGKTKEALDAFLEGYEINSKRTFILKALGDTYYDMGELKNAQKYYKEFLKINRYSDSNTIRKKVSDIEKKLKEST